ncbi:MAG: twin-arginine translocase TatA/TatE family subunit [Alphaproteobacteria bacterium]|nr:twin-arginine translocase TatA/TatE family subunit [Alphaproteobacteria bacterium]
MMPSGFELLIVLVLVLILFGAGRLPQVFEAFGQGLRKFREAQQDDPVEPDAGRQLSASASDASAKVVEADEVPKVREAAEG